MKLSANDEHRNNATLRACMYLQSLSLDGSDINMANLYVTYIIIIATVISRFSKTVLMSAKMAFATFRNAFCR